MSSVPNIAQPFISKNLLTKKKCLILVGIITVLMVCGGLYYWNYVRTSDGYTDPPDQGVEDDKPTFTLYYVTWCQYSSKFQPIWDRILTDADLASKVNLVSLECDSLDDKDKCALTQLDGYPTMKYFKNSTDKEGVPYEGDRTTEEIKAWVYKQWDARVKS